MQPTEIRLSADKRFLYVLWQDLKAELSAHKLRVESPSAEVKGHFGQGGVTPVGKELVTISALEPVGNYAVRIVFSDNHRTGIYTWHYLHELATRDQ